MEINQIRLFSVLVNERSFSRAARKLYISQPMITKAVKQIENEFGVQLVNRSSRSFALTDAGLRFHELSKSLLQHFDDVVNEISEFGTVNPRSITLARPPLSLEVYFPNILKLIKQEFSDINISLVECGSKNTVEMVRDGQADLGISLLPIDDPSIEVYPIVKDHSSKLSELTVWSV